MSPAEPFRLPAKATEPASRPQAARRPRRWTDTFISSPFVPRLARMYSRLIRRTRFFTPVAGGDVRLASLATSLCGKRLGCKLPSLTKEILANGLSAFSPAPAPECEHSHPMKWIDSMKHRWKQAALLLLLGCEAAGLLLDKAVVYQEVSHITVKNNQEVLLEQHPLKRRKLEEKAIQADPLYRWSKLRSEYLARANIDTARTIMIYGRWYGPGWYWDSFWGFYSYVPAWGVIYSPFGFGFYAPAWVWSAPILYYHYPVIAGPYYRRPVSGRGLRNVPRTAHAFHGVPRGGFGAATPRIPARGIAPAGGGFRSGGVSGGAGRR